jgi:hypothetical protein
MKPRLHDVLPLPPLALEFLRSINLGAKGWNDDSGAVRALPGPIPKGERNNALAAEAGRIARTARDGEEVERKLIAFNSDRCDPPVPEREARGIARRIWEKEKRSRAEGRKNRPRSSGPAVLWQVRSIDYPCSEPNALDDLGHLLDLAWRIACKEEMLIKTGKGRSRPAWVGDGEAELAARYLENRWSWSRKKLRRKLKQWEAWDLIEVLRPIRRGRANRVRLTGWVRCDPLWGQPSGASRGQPCGAYKPSPSNEVGGAPKQPRGQASGGGEGHNSTASSGGGAERWLRLSPNLEVSFPIDGYRAA